jgi:hypothetical protein
MGSVRCLVGDIPQVILADIIQLVIDDRPDIEVVCRLDDIDCVCDAVKENEIDVVILGEKAISLSQSVSDLLTTYPQTTVVAILNNGSRVCVCVEDFGLDDFVTMVRSVDKKQKANR